MKRLYRRLGPMSWSRDEWALLLFSIRGRAFGFFWGTVARELVLIIGCRIIERSVLGSPRAFAGGFHCRLSMSREFAIGRTSVFHRSRTGQPHF